MSNIYIQEPPTLGKVLLETSVGDIDIELWAKETPKACRNFVQLCLEGFYDGTIFHRVVKGFIVQGGDPTGTGEGGESIYGETFKDEFHSRLRFVRRGLVAMANVGKDDNGSQFFFTMGPAPELQNKHTIFGKVTGNTLYNMLKLEDTLVDRNERPRFPNKINNTKVLNNPFPDIVPRTTSQKEKSEKKDKKSTAKATKNFKLLSFGDEAEEDEEEVNEISKEYRGKSKSSHDLTDDPKLSSIPAVPSGDKRANDDDEETENEESELTTDEKVEQVRKKLKKEKNSTEVETSSKSKTEIDEKTEEIRKEVNQLKKDLAASAKKKAVEEQPNILTEAVKAFKEEVNKFSDLKTRKKKSNEREANTMKLLAAFQEKLQTARQSKSEETVEAVEEQIETKEDEEGTWLGHTLVFDSHENKVKDANMKDEDTYEIFDPRNPINQRRREASKHAMKKKR